MDFYTPPDYCLLSYLLSQFGKAFFERYPTIGDLEAPLDEWAKRYSTSHTFLLCMTQNVKNKLRGLTNQYPLIKNILLIEEDEEKNNIWLSYIFSPNNLYRTEPQEIECYGFPKRINLRNKKDIHNLMNLIKRDEITKKARDSLSSGKISAYCASKLNEKIDPHLWIEDKHWHSLLLDNAVYLSPSDENSKKETKKICFKKSEVDEFLMISLSESEGKVTPSAQASNYKALYEEELAKNKALNEKAENLTKALEAAQLQKQKLPQSQTKEYNSALKLILGVAMGVYGYNPSDKRSDCIPTIKSDMDLKGIAISVGTIRKLLQEAVEAHLPKEEFPDTL